MARKERFPDVYTSGCSPNYESEGSGSLERVDTTEESSAPRRKWIKFSSALNDGFGVPIQVLHLSKLSLSQKRNLALQLRGELTLVRAFQKKVDLERSQNVAVSSVHEILRSSNVQTGNRVATVGKLSVPTSGPGKTIDHPSQKARGLNRGATGRFQAANEKSAQGTSNAYLMKQCETLLKKLMTQEFSWVFNKPVDVVALKIPDYFNVIKHPMDLGTIKQKFVAREYSSPLEFAADVRLTFDNAKKYNPPQNDVHIMADTLSKFFELRWKVIEKKVPSNASQQPQLHDEIDIHKSAPPSKKRKLTSIESTPLPEHVTPVMSDVEKNSLSKELEALMGDIPDHIIEFLKKHSCSGKDSAEDEIEIDIDGLGADTLFTLRQLLVDHKENQNRANAEPSVMELNDPGISNPAMQLCKENENVGENVDVGGHELPVSGSTHPGRRCDKQTTSGNASDLDSSNSYESKMDDVEASTLVNTSKKHSSVREEPEELAGVIDKAENQSVSGLDQLEQISLHKPNSTESESRRDDGESAPSDSQVSPETDHRRTLLKRRFIDTIFKAREKTLQVEKLDPDKLRREKEELEIQKRKEKARLQAEAKAAEDAKRRAEAEAAAEAKRKIDLEREAARQALLKIEKTVEIDETSRFLEDLEMLRTVRPEQLPSSADEMSPEHQPMDAMGSFKFAGSNALEQLGLFIKMDEDEEEGEPPMTVPDDDDIEEGQID